MKFIADKLGKQIRWELICSCIVYDEYPAPVKLRHTLSPCKIQAVEQGEYEYLIVPMRQD